MTRHRTVVQRLHLSLWRKSHFAEHLSQSQAAIVEELMRAAYDMGVKDQKDVMAKFLADAADNGRALAKTGE